MGVKVYDSSIGAFKDAEIPKVYSNSTFVDSDGKVYDNGTWKEAWHKETELVIYEGNSFKVPVSNMISFARSSQLVNDPTFTNDYMQFTNIKRSSSYFTGKYFQTTNKIDISKYSYINATIEVYTLGATGFVFVDDAFVTGTADLPQTNSASIIAKPENTGVNTYSMPLSGLSGNPEKYIFVGKYAGSQNDIGTHRFYKVWLS